MHITRDLFCFHEKKLESPFIFAYPRNATATVSSSLTLLCGVRVLSGIASMAEQFTSLVNTFEGMSFADISTSNRSNPTQDLLNTIWELVTSCQSTSANAAHVRTVIEGTQTPSGENIARLSTLRREAVALAKTTKKFSDATEDHIMAYLTSLASPWTLEQKMLSHYSDEVKRIAGNVLDDETIGERSVMRRILEECYAQALCDSGTLHSDEYFESLEETSFEEPGDPDFESEEYYEHENRLAINDSQLRPIACNASVKLRGRSNKGKSGSGFGFAH